MFKLRISKWKDYSGSSRGLKKCNPKGPHKRSREGNLTKKKRKRVIGTGGHREVRKGPGYKQWPLEPEKLRWILLQGL